jgi:Leucine-rich repeat (LRR) protein
LNSQDFNRLIDAYSIENLNRISSTLITAYRRRRFDFLHSLYRNIGENTGNLKINELFSSLIMQYHPDRRICVIDQIKKYHSSGQMGRVQGFGSIFKVLDFIELHPVSSALQDSTKYHTPASPDQAETIRQAGRRKKSEWTNDFISALKQKEYGNLNVIYQPHDLHNIEGELELSGYRIDDLYGLEHCFNLTALNLSHNDIRDISALSSLTLLEKVDISFNRITHVNALSGMTYLRFADLSYNEIQDLKPLMHLAHLEYINCAGNKVPESQRRWFHRHGVIII